MTIYKQLKKGLSLLVVFFATVSMTMAQQIIKQSTDIFPAAKDGYKKLVIEVPHSANDDQKKIEFSVGKWMDVDACNHHRLMGTLEKKDLEGWGYNYYEFTSKGEVMSTMIGCLDNSTRHLFVSAEPEMVRYNGKLPIVIYVPEDMDVQFKIYKAEPDVYVAAEDRSTNKK